MIPPRRFSEPALEKEYEVERQGDLAILDMRAAVVFVLCWAYDVSRFLGGAGGHTVGALLKATCWLAAVGLKPVYARWLVGRDFYLQYRSWIITFTKLVFSMHPPGEQLHLASLASLPIPTAASMLPSTTGLLWSLAAGARLPFMVVTGLGWQSFFHNIPIGLALAGRAMKDNSAQCATPYFQSPRVQAMLRGVADRLTSLLSTSLSVGAGVKEQQASFPAGLDPCVALGGWAAACCFLLTTLGLATLEHRARSKFARRHATRLTPAERAVWLESSTSWGATWAATAALLAFAGLLAWQVAISLLTWQSGGHQPMSGKGV